MITEIHRAALDDGPGVRTVVFFKGCPLRCLWCHNPETQNPKPEPIKRRGKHETVGREATVAEIMDIVSLDAGHYKATGGGLTLSGGEPLAQPDFARVLLKEAKASGFHTCVETSGFGDVAPLVPYTDLWLFDIKGIPEDYIRLTGSGFEPVKKSLRTLLENGAEVILRCPVVPGIHESAEYEAYLNGLPALYPGVQGVERLPFHRLGMDKYEALGRKPFLP
ncbi:MAG: radical SAM protein [Defluviitaleaceae bacterium]|nr:radical SAM protein [Defluviitaleaceae bacterium]